MAVLRERPVSNPSAPHLPPQSTSVIQGSQNHIRIVHRLQDSLKKLRAKCFKTWDSFICHDVNSEQEELEPLCSHFDTKDSDMEETQLGAMEEVQLRPSKEWSKQLSDYEFLLGKSDQVCRRQTRSSIRAKRSHRATVMLPSVTRVTRDPVRCYVVIWVWQY